jgi:hypothetical protein
MLRTLVPSFTAVEARPGQSAEDGDDNNAEYKEDKKLDPSRRI